jgi:hypothetical protein
MGQLARQILPDKIRPCAQHLTELDERGAKLAQREADTNGRGELRDAAPRSHCSLLRLGSLRS